MKVRGSLETLPSRDGDILYVGDFFTAIDHSQVITVIDFATATLTFSRPVKLLGLSTGTRYTYVSSC